MVFTDSDHIYLGEDTEVIGHLGRRSIFLALPNLNGLEVFTMLYYRTDLLIPFREAILNCFKLETVSEIKMASQGLASFFIQSNTYPRSEFIDLLEKSYIVYTLEKDYENKTT